VVEDDRRAHGLGRQRGDERPGDHDGDGDHRGAAGLEPLVRADVDGVEGIAAAEGHRGAEAPDLHVVAVVVADLQEDDDA
jgi:hypothetical protein